MFCELHTGKSTNNINIVLGRYEVLSWHISTNVFLHNNVLILIICVMKTHQWMCSVAIGIFVLHCNDNICKYIQTSIRKTQYIKFGDTSFYQNTLCRMYTQKCPLGLCYDTSPKCTQLFYPSIPHERPESSFQYKISMSKIRFYGVGGGFYIVRHIVFCFKRMWCSESWQSVSFGDAIVSWRFWSLNVGVYKHFIVLY